MPTLVKILLSVPVGYGLAYPFLYPEAGGGILSEIAVFGPFGAALAVAGLLALIVLYALDLQRALALVAPERRRASPCSVLWMFVLPYNFIEDFQIVANVTNSLRAEARDNARLAGFKSFGMASGIGWCSAQILSLIPNMLGSVAGFAAIVLWIVHWNHIRRMIGALKAGLQPQPS